VLRPGACSELPHPGKWKLNPAAISCCTLNCRFPFFSRLATRLQKIHDKGQVSNDPRRSKLESFWKPSKICMASTLEGGAATSANLHQFPCTKLQKLISSVQESILPLPRSPCLRTWNEMDVTWVQIPRPSLSKSIQVSCWSLKSLSGSLATSDPLRVYGSTHSKRPSSYTLRSHSRCPGPLHDLHVERKTARAVVLPFPAEAFRAISSSLSSWRGTVKLPHVVKIVDTFTESTTLYQTFKDLEWNRSICIMKDSFLWSFGDCKVAQICPRTM
jgi:hypothetical protein